MSSRAEIISHIVDVCHGLAEHRMVTAADGNVSARLSTGNILVTRSGIHKGLVQREDVLEVTPDGGLVAGNGKPSTELGMHLYIYEQRPDIHAVVHAHPTYATGFATAGLPLDECLFPEVIVGLGAIPLARYATPSTPEVAESLAPHVKTAEAILLANHGAVTYGTNLQDAYFKMQKLEHAAHIAFVARMLGGARRLTEEDLAKLKSVSVQSYGKDFSGKPPCATDDGTSVSETTLREYIREKLETLGIR